MNVIDEELGSFHISSKGYLRFVDPRKLHGSILLSTSHHLFQSVLQLTDNLIGSIVRCVSVNFRHRTHGVGQFLHDSLGSVLLENTACHDAVGVDELTTEAVVLQQIEEQTNRFNIIMFVKHLVKRIPVPWIESIIEVETDIAEPSVITTAVSLDVVFWPVVITKEQLCSHIVGKLINIEQPFHFFIDALIIDALRQLTEMTECFIVTVIELTILKHVNFLIIVAIVRIHELVVTGLAQVEDALEFSVDVFRHLHRRLHIEVDAGTLDDGCQSRISKTSMVVPYIITAITYQQGLVTVERLLWEERIVEAVLPVEYLIRLEFHGTGIDVSCPSA